jgi:serine protein kinase
MEYDFEQLIQNDRGQRRNEYFQGTFLDYLNLIKVEPSHTKLAHQRVYELLTKRELKWSD